MVVLGVLYPAAFSRQSPKTTKNDVVTLHAHGRQSAEVVYYDPISSNGGTLLRHGCRGRFQRCLIKEHYRAGIALPDGGAPTRAKKGPGRRKGQQR